MINRILVAGGGTGGHLFPGIAVVEELRRRLPHLDVLFVGTERGIEARALPALGERFHAIEVKPLAGRTPAQLARNLAALPRSGLQALTAVRSFRPDVVIGLGGYVAGPVLLAAAALRVPTALLEQNVHVGLTNRLLSKSVGRAYLTHAETAAQFGAARARVLGNPVRRAFVDAARMALHDPAGARARSRSVFVLGGSQGARSLNESVPQALARAGIAQLGVSVVHQTGAEMADDVARRYRELGVQAEVVPFIDDVARAYANASLVIARAGATTLAELCAIGRAAILVPYPHAAEDHQTHNALALQRAGAAVAVAEADLDVDALAEEVRSLLSDGARRGAMEDAARRQGRPDAAAAIVDDLLAWLGVPSQAAPEPEREPEQQLDPNGGGDGQRSNARTSSESQVPIRRRPRVRRAELRIRALDASLDAVP
jgi:UDP-N-acetylglucosamine--N-acetylmuramyl-(pentapeptide) pyrophosphoryl-undecaprenol N-acetylglucosamine transferase